MHIYIKKQDKKTKKSTFKNVSFVWSVHVSFLLGSCTLAWVYNIFSSCQTHCSHHIPHTAPALWNHCIFHPFFLSIPCFSLCILCLSLYWSVFSHTMGTDWCVCIYVVLSFNGVLQVGDLLYTVIWTLRSVTNRVFFNVGNIYLSIFWNIKLVFFFVIINSKTNDVAFNELGLFCLVFYCEERGLVLVPEKYIE